jgi:hypothetical protein
MVGYLVVLTAVFLALLLWWRLLGKVARGLVVYAVVLYPPFFHSDLARDSAALVFNIPYLVETDGGWYARGYSHRAFRQARKGMTREEILDLLGQPIFRTPLTNGRECWNYGRDSSTALYVDATLVLDASGVVVKKTWKVEVD